MHNFSTKRVLACRTKPCGLKDPRLTINGLITDPAPVCLAKSPRFGPATNDHDLITGTSNDVYASQSATLTCSSSSPVVAGPTTCTTPSPTPVCRLTWCGTRVPRPSYGHHVFPCSLTCTSSSPSGRCHHVPHPQPHTDMWSHIEKFWCGTRTLWPSCGYCLLPLPHVTQRSPFPSINSRDLSRPDHNHLLHYLSGDALTPPLPQTPFPFLGYTL
jgi:hypothetical protein